MCNDISFCDFCSNRSMKKPVRVFAAWTSICNSSNRATCTPIMQLTLPSVTAGVDLYGHLVCMVDCISPMDIFIFQTLHLYKLRTFFGEWQSACPFRPCNDKHSRQKIWSVGWESTEWGNMFLTWSRTQWKHDWRPLVLQATQNQDLFQADQ